MHSVVSQISFHIACMLIVNAWDMVFSEVKVGSNLLASVLDLLWCSHYCGPLRKGSKVWEAAVLYLLLSAKHWNIQNEPSWSVHIFLCLSATVEHVCIYDTRLSQVPLMHAGPECLPCRQISKYVQMVPVKVDIHDGTVLWFTIHASLARTQEQPKVICIPSADH